MTTTAVIPPMWLTLMIDGSFPMRCNSHSLCKCEIQMSKGHTHIRHTSARVCVCVCSCVLLLANCRHLCPLGYYNYCYVNVFAYFLQLLGSCCPCLCKIKSLNSIVLPLCVCVCPKTVPRFSRGKLLHKNVTCVFVGFHSRTRLLLFLICRLAACNIPTLRNI